MNLNDHTAAGGVILGNVSSVVAVDVIAGDATSDTAKKESRSKVTAETSVPGKPISAKLKSCEDVLARCGVIVG